MEAALLSFRTSVAIIAITTRSGSAAPVSNASNPDSIPSILPETSSLVGFVSDPNQRGVYAPELVVFTAWRQWSSAKILGRKTREADHKLGEQDSSRRYEWTMAHNFYASTGGFAFEIDDLSRHGKSAFLPAGCPKRLTLTARGMAFLASCGHLPDVPKADIIDKSKANNLAKALVIIQASWLLIQVIGRLVAKLPVILLETNTIAHVAQSNTVDMEAFSSGQEGINSYQRQPHAEFAIASSTCHDELRTKRQETAAGIAFFERRPRVIGYNLALNSVDGSKRRRWELAAAATRGYPVIM
ncbi:MAG: hypothetical protein Q9225_004312 [Loekoesia sp. 1 TL-2023]